MAHVYVMDTGFPLGRPFVFVEGIDFNLSGTDAPLRLGDFGWSAFLGCEQDRYPMMAYTPVLLDSLLNRGFHPVLVDLADGSGDIPANAELLADILVHLRDHRSDPRPMVVSGASMGGQVARMALRLLEEAGEAHCTQLYLSLDSPHQGANVPLGLQQLIHHLPGEDPALNALREALMSPAARQLLLRQWPPAGGTRAQYQDLVDATGWPGHCRNAAIANGGPSPLGNDGGPLLGYQHALWSSDLIGEIGPLLDLQVYAEPGTMGHPLATPLAPVTCSMEMPADSNWPWPLEDYLGHGVVTDTLYPTSLDLMPGGTRPSMAQFTEAFNAALLELDLPWPLCLPPISPGDFQPLHSFIPTPSALAIPPPWHPGMLTDPLALSPFDAVHIGTTNEPHSEVNPANVAFVMAQLDLTECPVPAGPMTDTLNLTAGGHWGLPSLQVSGRLGLHSADASLGGPVAESGTLGAFRLQDCEGILEVLDMGTLELGGVSGSGSAMSASSARLTIHRGGVLRIAGRLILHAGSELVLEEGAVLKLSGGRIDQRNGSSITVLPGGRIEAEGTTLWSQEDASTWNLDGQVAIAPESHWQHALALGARWMTEASAQVHIGQGGEMSAVALQTETQWILAPGAQLLLDGGGTLELERMGLRLSGGAEWTSRLQAGTRWDHALWWGTEHDSIVVEGALFVHDLDAHGVCVDQSEGEYRMYDAAFLGGATTMDHNRIRWRNVACEDHPVSQLGLGPESAHLMESCLFSSAPSGLDLQGPGRIRMEDCRFESNATGLRAAMARVELACCHFTGNDAGLLIEKGLLVMRPEGGGGWNHFHHNDDHMRFILAVPPEISGGGNHFGDHFSHWASGSLAMACNGGGIDWLIPGQSWNWPDSWPQFMDGLWAPGVGGGSSCQVTAVDLQPIGGATCGGEGRPRED